MEINFEFDLVTGLNSLEEHNNNWYNKNDDDYDIFKKNSLIYKFRTAIQGYTNEN